MKKTSRAGVSDTRAGLQPAGLYSSAGLFKKGFQDFHPLDASPYLLFDASKSMVGTLENPTLDLDPSKPETLDVITATRSGVATYTDADGVIQQAAPNTVRVDYVDGVPMILVERSATNLVDHSTSFQTTGSVAQESGIDAPDGTNTATRITNISGALTVDAVYSRANSVSPSSEINGSIYLRGEAGEVVRLYVKRYSGGNFISTSAESVLLTGDWQRYESPSFTLNADNTNAAVTLRNDGDTTADSVDLWGAQIETGSVPTSYIPNPAVVSDNLNSVTSFEADGSTGGFNSIHTEGISGLSGKTVKVSFEVYDYEAGRGKAFAGISGSPSSVIPTNSTNIEANGVYSGIVTADADAFLVRNQNGAENFKAKVRNISIVEMDTSGARQADNLVISGSDFTDFYKSSEGTVYVELISEDDGGNIYPVYFTQAAGRNDGSWVIQKDSANNLRFNSWANGGIVPNSAFNFGSLTLGDLSRVSISYNSNSYEGSRDGSSVQTVTPSTMATTLVDRVFLSGNSRLKRLIYWPYHSDSL